VLNYVRHSHSACVNETRSLGGKMAIGSCYIRDVAVAVNSTNYVTRRYARRLLALEID
jgi:hypothetical protein